jgi:chromosome segregation ATPase
LEKNEILITDIFRKIMQELDNLETERNVLSNLIKELRKRLVLLDRRESKLRLKIAELVKKEAKLSKRKADLEKRLDKTRDRLKKMSEAKQSLSDAF